MAGPQELKVGDDACNSACGAVPLDQRGEARNIDCYHREILHLHRFRELACLLHWFVRYSRYMRFSQRTVLRVLQ